MRCPSTGRSREGGSTSVVGRREHGGAGRARGDGARWHRVLLSHRSSLRSPRHPRAPPCSCAARLPCPYLAPPAPPPSAAERVEPARIDTTGTDVPTRRRTRTGTRRCRRPRRARHHAARNEHGHGYRAPPLAAASAAPLVLSTCPPRLRSRIYPGFAHRHMHTSPARRAAPAHAVCLVHRAHRTCARAQISRPRLDVGLVYRSSAQVAVPHAPFLGAALPAALARVSRFIRSHTECTALASRLASSTSTAPRASCPPAWPLLARRLSCALCWRPRRSRPPRPRTPPISVHLRRTYCYFCSSSPRSPSPLCSLDVPVPFFSPASLASTRTAIPIRAR
ncbi:hypothetical protein B0H14DRAFT_1036096 [Mycena olivaceomarginata]|nr:hypothetical protein B0H14DRAFT_1036096 [Mycena olivaceomarginata]